MPFSLHLILKFLISSKGWLSKNRTMYFELCIDKEQMSLMKHGIKWEKNSPELLGSYEERDMFNLNETGFDETLSKCMLNKTI